MLWRGGERKGWREEEKGGLEERLNGEMVGKKGEGEKKKGEKKKKKKEKKKGEKKKGGEEQIKYLKNDNCQFFHLQKEVETQFYQLNHSQHEKVIHYFSFLNIF